MDEEVRACLRDIIEYLIHDERKSWEEDGRPTSHIYLSVKRVEDWLKYYEDSNDSD